MTEKNKPDEIQPEDDQAAETPKPRKVKRTRRVFQAGDPRTAPVQIVTYTSPPRQDANGFKYGPVTKVITRNAAFQFVLAADAQLYDEQLLALRAFSERSNGQLQEVGSDHENKVPDHLASQTPEQVAQDLQRTKAEKSTLDLKMAELIDKSDEQDAEINLIRQENEKLKKLVADMSK